MVSFREMLAKEKYLVRQYICILETLRSFLAHRNRYLVKSEIPYLLFLDEDYVFHSDYQHSGVESPVTSEKYYSEVNYMLAEIGRTLNLAVLIQPHPRANLKRVTSYFKHPISDLRTVDAVFGASLVLTHDSTAIGFGVLFNKPLLLLTTTEIKASPYQANIQSFARELGLSIVSVGDMPFSGNLPVVDTDKYERYKDTWLRPKGHDGQRGQKILSKFLKEAKKKILELIIVCNETHTSLLCFSFVSGCFKDIFVFFDELESFRVIAIHMNKVNFILRP